MDNLSSLSYFYPELILTVTALLVLCASLLGKERKGFDFPTFIALAGVAASFFAHLFLYSEPESGLFEGMIAIDPFAAFFKGFFILSTLIILIVSIYSAEIGYFRRSEYYAILITVCLGMCLVAS